MRNWKYRCTECRTIKDCKHAFGIYWAYKSSMGKGCDRQFRYELPTQRQPAGRLPPPTRKLEQGTMI